MTVAAETREARRIVVCYDGTPESGRALDRVVEIASATPTEVTVVSVAEPHYREPPDSGSVDEAELALHRSLLEEATSSLAGRGVAATTREPSGQAVGAIRDAALETEADVIVVGTRQRRVVERLLFGSVSGELAADAPCDVLIVR